MTDQLKSRTLKKEISFSGIGIHTGELVTMKFCPAPEGTGIIFKRVDLPGQPTLPASVEYVCDTARSTILGLGPVRIHTVEHVLAALSAYQIHNLYIELDNIEPPVANGSSDVFVAMIEEAGIKEQEGTFPIAKLHGPVTLSEGDIHLVALPYHQFRISYTLSYPEVEALKAQFCSLEVTSEQFKKEIAPCRTFSLYKEVSYLMDRGLIKGGSLDNAVVIDGDVVFSKQGLFFPDEMVRHKVLDMIGDLSLVGFPFYAHIIAIRSGHATNYQFAKMLYDHITSHTLKDKWRRFVNQNLKELDIKEIVQILPHRYPFLLVDRVLEMDLEKGTIVAQKNVSYNEAFFQGHFPGVPIMPGVLILEALAQAGGVLVHLKSQKNQIALLLNVNNAKFRHPVRPGDVLILRGQGLHFSSKGGRVKVEATVKEKLAVEAEIGFALVDKSQI